MKKRIIVLPLVLFAWQSLLCNASGSPESTVQPQIDIGVVNQMPRLPDPLRIINWKQTAIDYYQLVFDPQAEGPALPAVNLSADRTQFSFPSYLKPNRKDYTSDSGESMACLAPVIAAEMLGLDMTDFKGVNWVEGCKRWFSPEDGVYRNRPEDRGGYISHVIYEYWPLALGMMMTDRHYQDPDYSHAMETQLETLLQIARKMCAPDAPNFRQSYDLEERELNPPRRDWNPGNASCMGWMLYVGYLWTGRQNYLDCAHAALQWHLDHPGRYEVSHVMGPLAVARLNAEQGADLDLSRMMDIWFGDYKQFSDFAHHWAITHNSQPGGVACDGLDGAWWRWENGDGFYAFSMGSYQGPAWLLPVARYDQRFARAIARYALNAANSCRLFLGLDLDWDRQDHLDWRQSLPGDKGFLFSYEGLRTAPHHEIWYTTAPREFRPYATGDVLSLFSGRYHSNSAAYWQDKKHFSATAENIAIYMGNHIGFLGAVFNPTDVEGIIAWDLTITDYFSPPAYPSFLLYNPYTESRTVSFDVGKKARTMYDTVSGKVIRKNVTGSQSIHLAADQAMVLVLTPVRGRITHDRNHLAIDDIVVDYRVYAQSFNRMKEQY